MITITPTGDFIEQLDQTLEITNGVSANIVISINEDNIPENSEIFEVRLTEVTNAAFATGETQIAVMVTITDNDADPQISIDTTAQVDESEGNAMIPVTIPGTPNFGTIHGTYIDNHNRYLPPQQISLNKTKKYIPSQVVLG